ncbi:MAG TPA: hypothetical protein VN904_00830, partial [Chthoniobacterales bacterium]|nr:hypothetical protein [Chthoniobacterales bacterium]
WPCKETIRGSTYDRATAYFVAHANEDMGIYRTPDKALFFMATEGEPIQPCSKIDVISALIRNHISPAWIGDFSEILSGSASQTSG